MNNYISNLNIQSFRGIKNLQIDNIGGVNILVGGNNTGKTSVLEAIELFCCPNEYDLIRISKQRDRFRGRFSLNTLDSLLFMFNVNSSFDKKNKYQIDIGGTLNGSNGSLNINCELVSEMLDLKTLSKINPLAKVKLSETDNSIEEVQTFIGSISHTLNQKENTSIEINNYSRFIGRSTSYQLVGVKMINTIDHILQNPFRLIIKNKELKDTAVAMLKKFDNTIEDIRYISEENSFIPVIEDYSGKYIPLSFYGDGMKKSLTILNSIVSARGGGIVLIDEFETALHTSAMTEIFRFMLEVAKELNVQLFLTTHSIEAVDKLLECSKEYLNDIRVIRLKKTEDKMFAKVTNGDIALENRIEYDMELRV